MENTYLEQIESTPTLQTKRCKLLALCISLALQSSTILSAIITWYIYDYFIAGASFLLAFIIMGIVRSKIRNAVIPFAQREHPYTDKELAIWLSARELCLEEKENEVS